MTGFHALKKARQDAANVLTEQGLNAYVYSPEKFSPPLAYVIAGSPYIDSEGASFAHRRIHLEARLVTRPGSNEAQTDNLDADIENALIGLINAGYSVETVTQPYALLTDSATFTAVSIHMTTTIRLGE